MTLGIVFSSVCTLYGGSFLIGWRLAKAGRLDVQQLAETRRRLTDPVTSRFQRWHDEAKMNALREGRWTRMWLVISANNLFAVALVSRTLYAVTPVLPAYMTYRQGIVQGAICAMAPARLGRAFLRVAVLEFGAYLLATSLGLNVVVSLVATGSVRSAVMALLLLYPLVAVAVLAGTFLEIQPLRAKMPAGVRISENLNMEELRSSALEMMRHRPGGGITSGRG